MLMWRKYLKVSGVALNATYSEPNGHKGPPSRGVSERIENR